MVKITDIYYKIWVDCLVRMRAQEANANNWKEKSMIAMSIAMTCKFFILMTIFERYVVGSLFYEINISFLSEGVNDILSILLLFFLPCVIINYLLIFRKKKYEKLIEKYPYHNGKLAATYIVLSIALPVALVLIGAFLLQ